jgi:hypothetical protein
MGSKHSKELPTSMVKLMTFWSFEAFNKLGKYEVKALRDNEEIEECEEHSFNKGSY